MLPADRSSCARIPRRALRALAALRAHPKVLVAEEGDDAWVHWPAGDALALRAVLAVRGAELFVRSDEDGDYRRLGERLPCSRVKRGGLPLRLLLPLPDLEAAPPPAAAIEPVPLGLARSAEPRATAASLAPLSAVARWAETATTSQLAALRAAIAGDLVALLGSRIPALANEERFWSEKGNIFVPLGHELSPPLMEGDVRAVTEARPDEMVFVRAKGCDLVPRAAFSQLSRASVRLARGGTR